jgi:hypothetical protein
MPEQIRDDVGPNPEQPREEPLRTPNIAPSESGARYRDPRAEAIRALELRAQEDSALEYQIEAARDQSSPDTKLAVVAVVIDDLVRLACEHEPAKFGSLLILEGKDIASPDDVDYYSVGLTSIQRKMFEQVRGLAASLMNTKNSAADIRGILEKTVHKKLEGFEVAVTGKAKVGLKKTPRAPVAAPPSPAPPAKPISSVMKKPTISIAATLGDMVWRLGAHKKNKTGTNDH